MKNNVERTPIFKILFSAILVLGITYLTSIKESYAVDRGRCVESTLPPLMAKCLKWENELTHKEKVQGKYFSSTSVVDFMIADDYMRRKEKEMEKATKQLSEKVKAGCCEGGACKVQAEEFSCNLMDNSPVDKDVLNSSAFGALSLITMHTQIEENNTPTMRGTKKFCEDCYTKVFNSYTRIPQSFEVSRKNVIYKAKIQKAKQEVKKLAGTHFKLKAYYNKYKDIIEEQLRRDSKDNLFNTGGAVTDIIAKQMRNNNLCLPFEKIAYEVGNVEMESYDFDSKDLQISSKEHRCEKNSKKMMPELVKELGLDVDSSIDLTEQSLSDSEVGEALNEALAKLSKEKVDDIFNSQSLKNIEDSRTMINSFYNLLPDYLGEGHSEIKSACKSNDEYVRRSLILPVIFKEMVKGDSSQAIKLKRSVNILEVISMMDPDLSPFISSTESICNFINTNTAQEVRNTNIADVIKMKHLSEEKRNKAIFKQFNKMSKTVCNSYTENITHLICSEDDDITGLNFNQIDADQLDTPEKITLASLRCDEATPKSVKGFEGIDIYALNDNAFIDANMDREGLHNLPEKLKVVSVQPMKKLSGTERFHRSSNKEAALANNSNQKVVHSVSGESSGGGESTIGSGSAKSAGADSDADTSRNFIQNGEQIIAQNGGKKNESSAETKGIMEVSTAVGGDVGTTVGSPIPSIASGEKESFTEEPTIEAENSFNTKMQNILSESAGNTNYGNYNFGDSAKTVAEMIDEEVSETEVMNTLNENENIAGQFVKVKEKLEENLAPGEDVNEALQKALTGEEAIEQADLTCKSESTDQCKKDNSDLLAEIQDLKAQVAASTKAKRAEEVESTTDKRIKALEEELAKFKQIASAKVDTTSPSISTNSTLGGRTDGSSGVTISGSEGQPLLRSERRPASVATGTQMERSGQAFKGDKIITNSVKKDPDQYIKKKDFDLSLSGNSLVLTIDSEQIQKAPVDLDSIVLDPSGQVQEIVITGGKPISLTSLSTSSRAAVEKFIASNKGSFNKQTKNIETEITQLEEVQELAKAESVRYNQLLCSMNPSSKGCSK